MYYKDIENNIIYILYTLRTTLNWYNFITERPYLNYSLPIDEIKQLIIQLKNLIDTH